MKKYYIVSILLSILSFTTALVFLMLSGVKNISEFSPLSFDYSQLRYIDLFLSLCIASFVAAILFFATYAIGKLKYFGRSFFAISLVVTVIVFTAVTAPNAVTAVKDYSEYAVYTDIQKDEDIPVEKYIDYFPCFDKIYNATGFTPYFSISEYKLGTSILKTSQLFNNDGSPDAKDLGITIDYFETDKSYLMSKYQFEKSAVETTDEEGNPLPASTVQQENYGGYMCNITVLKTEKRLKIQGENYYFTLTVDDEANDLQMDNNALLQLGISQLELLKNQKIPFSDADSMI